MSFGNKTENPEGKPKIGKKLLEKTKVAF